MQGLEEPSTTPQCGEYKCLSSPLPSFNQREPRKGNNFVKVPKPNKFLAASVPLHHTDTYQGLEIECNLDGIPFVAVIDTGATGCIIDICTNYLLGGTRGLLPTTVQLKSVDNTLVQILGERMVHLELNDYYTDLRVLVADVMNSCLLGMDFLTEGGAILDIGHRTLTMKRPMPLKKNRKKKKQTMRTPTKVSPIRAPGSQETLFPPTLTEWTALDEAAFRQAKWNLYLQVQKEKRDSAAKPPRIRKWMGKDPAVQEDTRESICQFRKAEKIRNKGKAKAAMKAKEKSPSHPSDSG